MGFRVKWKAAMFSRCVNRLKISTLIRQEKESINFIKTNPKNVDFYFFKSLCKP